jgi:hypothetical protein
MEALMVDPLSMTVLGGVAVTEGIKFLYGQATELLRRRAARKEAEAAGKAAALQPVIVEAPPDLLQGELKPVTEDANAVDELADELDTLRKQLSDYIDGIAKPDAADPVLDRKVDALRTALESAMGQRITFKGEQRNESGTVVTGRVSAKVVRGIASGIDTDVVKGEMHGSATAETVEPGARLSGTRIRTSDDR